MGTFLEGWQNCQEGQRMCKSCLMILLRFAEIYLHYGNKGTVSTIFEELWVIFFGYVRNYGSQI